MSIMQYNKDLVSLETHNICILILRLLYVIYIYLSDPEIEIKTEIAYSGVHY